MTQCWNHIAEVENGITELLVLITNERWGCWWWKRSSWSKERAAILSKLQEKAREEKWSLRSRENDINRLLNRFWRVNLHTTGKNLCGNIITTKISWCWWCDLVVTTGNTTIELSVIPTQEENHEHQNEPRAKLKEFESSSSATSLAMGLLCD